MIVASRDEVLPPDTEQRLEKFTELIATAIANAETSRARAQLADEQAALHRMAMLVAEGVPAQDIFDAVCLETSKLLGARAVNLSHYTSDGFNLTVAGTHLPVGTRVPIEPDTVAGAIIRTRAPARVDDWDDRPGQLAALLRDLGVRSSLGVPIFVEGRLWGALAAGTDEDEPLPAGTEARLGSFAELLATALSNAATRTELIESRARIVAAGDEARHRIERNLHDGTQQRLIALGLDIQRVRATIPQDQYDTHLELERLEKTLETVLEDLRELSRGLHPPLLARRGLRSSLRALARNSPIPVELEIDLPERPPAPIEIAIYYVVSEALTNAIKHSQASAISITVETDHASGPAGADLDGRSRGFKLHATIADNGVGGADASSGSGLTGLTDRVEALGGRLALDTPSGGGTRISIELPLEKRLADPP
jgi:signal transduction histidine kinase